MLTPLPAHTNETSTAGFRRTAVISQTIYTEHEISFNWISRASAQPFPYSGHTFSLFVHKYEVESQGFLRRGKLPSISQDLIWRLLIAQHVWR